MAPVKRSLDDAMLGPIDSLDFNSDDMLMFAPHKKFRDDAFDLSTYLDSANALDAVGGLDAVVPSMDLTESVKTAIANGASNSGPWLSTHHDATAAPVTAPGAMVVHDLPGDASDFSDSDNGYNSLFGTPEHVLESSFDDPLALDDVNTPPLLITSTITPQPHRHQAHTPTQSPPLDQAQPQHAEPEVQPAVTAPQPPQHTQQQHVAPPQQQQPHMAAQGHPINSVRWAHNSTERKRRLEIRRLFSGLRDLFPDLRGDDKISNINTLNRAIDHVAELTRQHHDTEAALQALRQRNAQLKAARAGGASCEEVCGEMDAEGRRIPTALRQLRDHNTRGQLESKPLAPRRQAAKAGAA